MKNIKYSSKLFYALNAEKLNAAVSIFLVILIPLCLFFTTRYFLLVKKNEDFLYNSKAMVSILKVEKIWGYPPFDSGHPTFEGLHVSYFFKINNTQIEGVEFIKNDPINNKVISVILNGVDSLVVLFDSTDYSRRRIDLNTVQN